MSLQQTRADIIASHSLEQSLRTHGAKRTERAAQPQRKRGAPTTPRAVVYTVARAAAQQLAGRTVKYVERSLLAGRFRQEVDVDEVRVDVDQARHALAAGGDETQLGDGLHLGEATRPPEPRRLRGDHHPERRALQHGRKALEGDA